MHFLQMLSTYTFPLLNLIAAACCLVLGERRPGQSWRWLGASSFLIGALSSFMYLVLSLTLARAQIGGMDVQALYGGAGLINVLLGIASTVLGVLAIVKGRASQPGPWQATSSQPSSQPSHTQPGYQQSQPGTYGPYGGPPHQDSPPHEYGPPSQYGQNPPGNDR